MSTHTITIANRENATYEVDAKKPLLDSLRDQGVDLPYGCKYGGCITCAAKLLDGDVNQKAQVALNNRQINDVYPSLAAVDRPIDMVEVFRRSEDLPGVAEEAVAVGAKVLWGQIGVTHPEAAKIAEAAGMKVVMDRCPKIELFRPFWKPRLDLENLTC
ncbi:hypothetical protein GQR58_005122 [Nymphon striatum]|nr:hypothetical protein GQR58_005122 [Nymphon striatum]